MEDAPFEDVDPDRLGECRYWRCGELFEQRSVNHRYCRKACRSRDKKWRRSVERKNAKLAAQRAIRSATSEGNEP